MLRAETLQEMKIDLSMPKHSIEASRVRYDMIDEHVDREYRLEHTLVAVEAEHVIERCGLEMMVAAMVAVYGQRGVEKNASGDGVDA